MMVQTAPAGEAHFVCTMADHNALCGQFAQAFGNDDFERVAPFDEMLFVTSHHDYGWSEWDADPLFDAKSGLPAGLGQTPAKIGLEANRRSPEYNEKHHPYCGLLSSMHSWGLFNARYGYSQFRVRKGGSTSVPIPDEAKDQGHSMLDGEVARQARLKAALAADPRTRGWVEDKHLFQNYKQLQFFDTLALYFNLRHAGERDEEVYTNVPRNADEETSIRVRPVGEATYALAPFPFVGRKLEVSCRGRYVKPLPGDTPPAEAAAHFKNLPITTQVYTFVAG